MNNQAAAPTTAILSEKLAWTDFERDAVEREGARQQGGGKNEDHSVAQMNGMMAALVNGFENANQLLKDM
jgi:hypothetical protein